MPRLRSVEVEGSSDWVPVRTDVLDSASMLLRLR